MSYEWYLGERRIDSAKYRAWWKSLTPTQQERIQAKARIEQMSCSAVALNWPELLTACESGTEGRGDR